MKHLVGRAMDRLNDVRIGMLSKIKCSLCTNNQNKKLCKSSQHGLQVDNEKVRLCSFLINQYELNRAQHIFPLPDFD